MQAVTVMVMTGVRATAEECADRRTDAVAEQGLIEAGLRQEVTVDDA